MSTLPRSTRHLPLERSAFADSIVERFNRIVEVFPDREALSSAEGESISYQQLDQKSNQIANAILKKFGDENEPILLLLDHTLDLIVSILGIIKANKAYVALDPRQPHGQLASLAKATDSPLLLTSLNRLELARKVAEAEEIWQVESLADRSSDRPEIHPSPHSFAGIFFTSGTINQPKAVARSHQFVMHRVWFETKNAGLTYNDRFSGIRQCGLGSGMSDVFNSLLNGGTYALYSLHDRGLSELTDWLIRERVTYFDPSIHLYRQWLDTLPPNSFFPNLRIVRATGRKMDDDIRRLWTHVPDSCVFVTSYSATETSLISWSSIDRTTPIESGVTHVGAPISDRQVSIIGKDGQPVNSGEPGEVYVRGRFLPVGYWRNPDLSSVRFDAADDEGKILYRTGDWGRMRPDGFLELIGRQDSQVRLRGYRLSIDELEDALRNLPAISDAAVLVDTERGTLSAYLTTASAPPPSVDDLRTELEDVLPTYAIPNRITYVSKFPMSTSGKINRKALSELDSQESAKVPKQAAQSQLEEELIRIWARILGRDEKEISTQDDFFAIGGHSLSAMRLILEIERQFDCTIDLNAFAASPSISHLATELERKTQEILDGKGEESSAIQSSVVKGLPTKTLEEAYRILDLPPHERRKFKRSQWSTWDWARRFTFLVIKSTPTSAQTSLLRRLTSNEKLQCRSFRYYRPEVINFLTRINCEADFETALASSLYFGMVYRYFLGVVRRKGKIVLHDNVSLQVNGLEKLEESRRKGRGAIIVRSHDNAQHFFRTLDLADYRVGSLRSVAGRIGKMTVADENTLYMYQLNRAREELRRGKIVEVHGDGLHGTSQGQEYRFHQRIRPFQAGFAELALLSDADVFVVDSNLEYPLQATLNLLGPLDKGGDEMSHEKRCQMLVDQYVKSLYENWAHRPWMVDLGKMTQHLANSIDEKGASTPEAV